MRLEDLEQVRELFQRMDAERAKLPIWAEESLSVVVARGARESRLRLTDDEEVVVRLAIRGVILSRIGAIAAELEALGVDVSPQPPANAEEAA